MKYKVHYEGTLIVEATTSGKALNKVLDELGVFEPDMIRGFKIGVEPSQELDGQVYATKSEEDTEAHPPYTILYNKNTKENNENKDE